jgi:formylglycine-generating enzyme required for sulfatase activity
MNIYTQDADTAGGSTSIGTSSIIYLSIPDPAATTSAGSNCSALGFPSTGYHCAGPNFFRKTDGTGWIPVNFANMTVGSSLGQLPTDPVNTSSSGEYYEYTTNGTTWKMTATPESTQYASQLASFSSGSNQNLLGGFPNNGWIPVPGNGTFGTHNFSVMQYDAVCSDGQGNVVNTPNDGQGYNNNTTNCANPASLPGGFPIVDISQTTASSSCASIGAHLITNAEWQTIAWNAENQASNWSGGTVGGTSQYMPRGNSNSSWAEPAGGNAYGLAASTSTYYSDFTHLRTLTLSNGGVIWDLAGNVWQWTNDQIIGTNQPYGGTAGFTWREFTAITNWGTMTQSTAGPANSAWNSTQGMGQIYSDGSSNSTNYGFLRGGAWNNGSVVGVEYLYLSNTPGSTHGSLGFRCAR